MSAINNANPTREIHASFSGGMGFFLIFLLVLETTSHRQELEKEVNS